MFKGQTKSMNATLSVVIAGAIIVLLNLGFVLTGGLTGEGTLNRLFILLGGNIKGGGYIQLSTYLAFCWAMLDILAKRRAINHEYRGLELNILPRNEKNVIMSNEVKDIVEKTRNIEKQNVYLLTDLIKKAGVKFRSSKSVSEMMDMISIQVEINKEKSESEQSNIRYLTWGIPSLGFIGTVLGISQALTVANSGDMNKITSVLGVAFDTTLVSLVLSIIIMWYFHDLQEKTDHLHATIKEHVMEHLVNRIEH